MRRRIKVTPEWSEMAGESGSAAWINNLAAALLAVTDELGNDEGIFADVESQLKRAGGVAKLKKAHLSARALLNRLDKSAS